MFHRIIIASSIVQVVFVAVCHGREVIETFPFQVSGTVTDTEVRTTSFPAASFSPRLPNYPNIRPKIGHQYSLTITSTDAADPDVADSVFATATYAELRDEEWSNTALNYSQCGNDFLGCSTTVTHDVSSPISNFFHNSPTYNLLLNISHSPGGGLEATSSQANASGTVRFKYEIPDENLDVCPETLVFVTHGWQRDGNLEGLPEIHAAVEERLAPGVANGTALVRESKWRGAVTGSYLDARAATTEAGKNLANEIRSIIDACREHDPNYKPKIHLIGHSLGTMVNAEAAYMLPDIFIDQITMLDTPLAPTNSDRLFNSIVALNDHDPYFFDKYSNGNVGYVENIYVDTLLPTIPRRFGQPIDGGFNLAIPGVDHVTLAKEFYPELIKGTQSDLPDAKWNSPALEDWEPGVWQRHPALVDLISLTVSRGFGSVFELPLGSWLLETNSPASIVSESFVIPTNASHIHFFITPETSDGVATLRFNDTLLWIADFTNLDESTSIIVPIGELKGMEGVFTWEINSFGGSQRAAISGLELVLDVSEVIPEPNSIVLIFLATQLLYGRAFQNARGRSYAI